MKDLRSKFSNEGFLIFDNFIKSQEFKQACIEINQNLESIINKTNLKKIGGFLILDDAQRYIDNNNENEWFQFKEKVKNWEYIPTDNWVSRTDLWKKII